MKQLQAILLLFVLTSLEVSGQLYPIKFERIGAEQGFPQSSVNVMVQDSIGFLWFGTPDGLYKYDGYTFTPISSLKNDSLDQHSLADNNIQALFMGTKGKLWIGTAGGGLNCYDLNANKITKFKVNPNDQMAISDITVRGITEDKSGFIWVATANGLNRLDQTTGIITKYFHDPNNSNSPSGNDFRCIYSDSKNNIWVGGENESGLVRYNITENKFENYKVNSKLKGSVTSNVIRAFDESSKGVFFIGTDGGGLLSFNYENGNFNRFLPRDINPAKSSSIDRILSLQSDSSGNLWIGTIGGGVAYFDLKKNEIYHHRIDPANPTSLSNNRIPCMLQSNSKIMWFGTWGGGISKYAKQKEKFVAIRNNPDNPNSLSENTIRSFYETNDGKIWIGTIAGGLNEFDRKNNSYIIYKNKVSDSHSLSNNDVSAITEIDSDNLLVGTWRGGLTVFNRKTKSFNRIKSELTNSISDDRIQRILHDSMDVYWIGTENGLNQFHLNSNKVVQYKNSDENPKSLSDNRVQTLLKDSEGSIWIGTWSGLNYFDRSKNEFIRFLHSSGNKNSLNNNSVISLYQDEKNILWVGTYGGGLNKFIINNSDISKSYVEKFYTEDNGLSNNSIYGILEDQQKNLWLSTTKGLSRFSPETESFRNYDEQDGLQSNEFFWGAFLKTKNGTMFFGGVNGFNMFNPTAIYHNANIPPIVITAFNRFGKQIQTENSLNSTNEIVLDYEHNSFSLEFAALDYVNSMKNHYSYKLEGFNTEWVQSGINRTATYTNLSGGTYVFNAIGSNSDHVWNNEGVRLTIVINPPYWQTWWFRFLAVSVVFGLVYVWYKSRVRKIELQKENLEIQVSERTLELKSKKDELEKINSIVKNVNAETQFKSVIHAIVKQLAILNNVEVAVAFIYDKDIDSYRMNSGIGIDTGDFDSITFKRESIEKLFIKDATEFSPDIWLTTFRPFSGSDFFSLGFLKTIVAIPIRVDHDIQGYLIFGNKNTRNAFSENDLHLFGNLKEHLISAFIKTRILEELSALNEKKNEFLAFAAHDLRNPLTIIINYLSLVTEQIKKDDFNKDKSISDLEKVLTVTQNMSEMVTTLLDISSIESGKVLLNIKKGSLNEILHENEYFHKRLATQKNIKLEYLCDNGMTEVVADHERIVEVVDNLVSNAIKYTYPGGNIKIYCEKREEEIITHIQDNGQGLTQDDMTHIFNTYTKLSARPTAGESSNGLGLAIVKKIVTLHGGKVWVVSEKGKGSIFSFSLPISKN